MTGFSRGPEKEARHGTPLPDSLGSEDFRQPDLELSEADEDQPRSGFRIFHTLLLLVACVLLALLAGVLWHYWQSFPQISVNTVQPGFGPALHSFYPTTMAPDGARVWILQSSLGKAREILFDLETCRPVCQLEGGFPLYWLDRNRMVVVSLGNDFRQRVRDLAGQVFDATLVDAWWDPRPMMGLHLVDGPRVQLWSQTWFPSAAPPVFNYYALERGMVLSTPALLHVAFPRTNDDWIIQELAPLAVRAESLQAWRPGQVFLTMPGEQGTMLLRYGADGYKTLTDSTQLAAQVAARKGNSSFPPGQLTIGPALLTSQPSWARRGEVLFRIGLTDRDQRWDEIWACHSLVGSTTPLVRLGFGARLVCSDKWFAATEQVAAVTAGQSAGRIRIGQLDTGRDQCQVTSDMLGDQPGGIVFHPSRDHAFVIGASTGRIWSLDLGTGTVQFLCDTTIASATQP